ncbi:MAG: hypothetical protein E6Q99_04280 [Elusimicrobia bacterium]|nr:MAG: hypothetical protein E6Q99_04280 [Elusimicrobiota bacterium]
MSPLLSWVIVAFALGAFSMVLFISAIVAKRFSLLYLAIGVLALAGISGAYVIYRVAERSVDGVRELFTPRTGEAIYADLFGAPIPGTVQVTAYDDAQLPKLDIAIHLRRRIQRPELRRILSAANYSPEGTGSSPDDRKPTYDPSSLGPDHIDLHATISEGRHWRSLYLSADSSEVIVVDVAD